MLKNIHIVLIGLALFILLQTFLDTVFAVLTTLVLLFSWLAFNIFSIKHSLFLKSICRIRTKEKIVFLSFDDGPSVQFTPVILDILNRNNVKALFFCIGQHAEVYPDLVRRISSEGHRIGNHTFSHNWRNAFKPSGIIEAEISKTNDILFDITGSKPDLFRPPFGITNPSIAKALKNSGLHSVGWDIRSFDTISKDPQKLIRRISDKLRPGSIILLHDNREITSRILNELIQTIQNKGYKIVSLADV
ncbi:MAG: polysaccharide deacetylase family protein [Bacteroidales bacterium]|nr:polysaccharide deacetylase family protein [Bacteroidales bacterium]